MNIFHLARARHEESPRSVMIRTAHANGFGSVSAMARAFGSKDSLQPFAWQMKHSELVNKLASYEHLNGDQFQASFYSQIGRTCESPVEIMGLVVPSASVRADAYSFCPDCLKSNMYPSILDLTWLQSCPYHDCQLLPTCPNCARGIRWTQLSSVNCQCGCDLSGAPTIFGRSESAHRLLNIFRTNNQSALDRFIFSLKALRYTSQSEQADEKLAVAARIADCDTTIFAELTHASALLYPCLPIRPLLAPWLVSKDQWILSQAQNQLQSHTKEAAANDACKCIALKLFQEEMVCALKISPTMLRSLLTRDLVQREKSGKIRWKYSSRKLCLLLGGSEASPIHTMPSCDSTSSLFGTNTYFTIEEAATRLDVYPDAIRSALKRGFMQSGLIKGDKGRTFLHVETVNHFFEHYVFVGQLAANLSVPRTTLSAKLLHLGVSPISGPSLDGCLVTIYWRNDIDAETLVQLRSLLQYKTKAGRKPKGFNRRTGEETLSSANTARMLGVFVHDLKHLEQQGYIVRSINHKAGRYFTTTSVKKTKAMLASMVSLKGISLIVGMSPQTFSRRYIQSGYLKHIRLGNKTLLPEDHIRRVQEHRNVFISVCEADGMLGASNGHTANLVRLKKLTPLTSDEEGYVSTVRLLRRTDVNKIK